MRGISLGAGAVMISLIFWKLQFTTDAICCGDFDGYYHARWSQLLGDGLRNRAFPPVFTWLPLTTLNPAAYVDHHFLFHIFQMPFTFGDLRLGTKIASVIFASLAVFSCYWLLIHFRIRYPLVWLVALLASSSPFLYRLNMAKAPPFAIIYLIAGIYLLFKRKYWLIAPLAFVFTLTYDLSVLLILAVLIWVAVVVWSELRLEWRPVAWVILGTAAGFIINPYFPENFTLFYQHLRIKLVVADFSTKVGQEWYPYTSWEFLGNSLVACVAMVVGYIAFDPAERKRSHYPLFFLILSTILMIMNARWKRIAEYWPPFAVMFAAFSLQPWLAGARSVFTRLPSDIMKELEPFLDRSEPARDGNKELWQTISAAVVALILGVALALNLYHTAVDIESGKSHDYYRAGAEWMRANVPAAEMIFHTDWDDFPRLFYYDPSHKYISGLDPTYLYDRDPSLSKLYDRITLGQERDPGPLIRDRFGARYVFTDNEHDEFFVNAIDSGWFDIVYEDAECTILRIRDQKGAAPPDEEPVPDAIPDEEPAAINEQS